MNKLTDHPYLCLEANPTAQTTHFCDKYINLTRLAESTELSLSHLSLIFNGHREPSLKSARVISRALGMTLSSFDAHLHKHQDRFKSFLDSQSVPVPTIQ